MRTLLTASLLPLAFVALTGCDVNVKSSEPPTVEKKETTIVNPAPEKKVENNTTVVNPAPEKK